MAFTVEQLANLEKAAASGQLRVQLGDKVVQYQTLDLLLKAIAMARADVATANAPPATETGGLRYRVAAFLGG